MRAEQAASITRANFHGFIHHDLNSMVLRELRVWFKPDRQAGVTLPRYPGSVCVELRPWTTR